MRQERNCLESWPPHLRVRRDNAHDDSQSLTTGPPLYPTTLNDAAASNSLRWRGCPNGPLTTDLAFLLANPMRVSIPRLSSHFRPHEAQQMLPLVMVAVEVEGVGVESSPQHDLGLAGVQGWEAARR